MPKKKSKRTKTKAGPAPAAAAPGGLPQPEHVPKERVGEVVQDFIDVGGATTVVTQQEDSDTWLVRATG